MCGIVGMVGTSDVNVQLYDSLTVLQHRGQDAAGISTCHEGRVFQQKGNGMVRDVFQVEDMQHLVGNMGIGHVRYPTAGSSSVALAQPFYVNSPYGISLSHNGNLTNSDELVEELFRTGLRHVNTDSDSEVLLNIFAFELQQAGKLVPEADDIFTAVAEVHRRCHGAYAVTAMIANYGIVGFRDPNGIRPLVFGSRESEGGTEYMIASESVALDVLGFVLIRDVEPGEAIYIEQDGTFYSHQCAENPQLRPCIFEYVYFARPDSIMDGVSVYKSRMRMGEKLAEKILRLRPGHDIDVVIPVPDTSRVAGQILAHKLGVKFREGLMKNRYIGRTFIMPGQKQRRKSVRQKLNAIDLEFRGKNVLLVDDSIVRGTTCEQIVQMARDAGANKVYFASAAPPVKYPNVYGIDMPTPTELIAHERSEEEVREAIGADWLVYQDLSDLIASTCGEYAHIEHFECSVFTGEYITGVDQAYLNKVDARRNDVAKKHMNNAAANVDSSVVGIYNA
jgi:amidophosphoribosyltransferase